MTQDETDIETIRRLAESRGWGFLEHYSPHGSMLHSCVAVTLSKSTSVCTDDLVIGWTFNYEGPRTIIYWSRLQMPRKIAPVGKALVTAEDADRAAFYLERYAHHLDQAGHVDYDTLCSIREMGKRFAAAAKAAP